MALAAVTVENYRSFLTSTTLELRPLTLLFGYNSVGKSALMRTLPLLAASVDPTSAGPLALGSAAARGATFADLRSQLGSRREIAFGLRWDDDHSLQSELKLVVRNEMLRSAIDQRLSEQTILDQLVFQQTWLHEPSSVSPPAQEALALGILARKSERRLEARWNPLSSDDTQALNRYQLLLNESLLGIAELELEGLIPVALGFTNAPLNLDAETSTALFECQKRLRSLRTQIHWLGAVRTLPQRRSPYGGSPRRLQPDGSGAGDVLAADDQGDRGLLTQVSGFYERATRHRLELRRQGELFSLILSPLGVTPVQVNILDTGEGMAQVLPVLVLGAMAAQGRLGKGAILCIEQPELHLHAAAQAELASYFCRVAKQVSGPRLLVETHSENFLLRVQLEILRGALRPEDVLVYWVRQLEDGRSVAEPIPFDELARPQGRGWPPGVFSEDVEQARQIAMERRKQAAR